MIRVGVVGVGNMGRNHLRVYKSLEAERDDLIVVGFADKDPERVRLYSKKYSVKGFTSYQKLLEEGVDAVSIAVPTSLHRKVALDFIRGGVNVLVEKPIAPTYEEAMEIIEEAEKHGVVLMTGHVERFNPAVSKLKQIIMRGELGNLLVLTARRVGPYPPQIRDSGVAIDLSIHDLDIFQYLSDKIIIELDAKKGKALNKQYEDYAIILATLENGAYGVSEANWLTPYKLRKLYITGTRAVAEVDYIEQSLKINTTEYSIDVIVHKEEPLKIELNHFINVIAGIERPVIDNRRVAHIIKLLNEAS